MKEYLKPEAEVVEFATEVITSQPDLDPVSGGGEEGLNL